MRDFFDNKLNTVLSVLLVIVSVFIVVQTVFAQGTLSVGKAEVDATVSNVNPNLSQIMANDGIEITTKAKVQPTTQKQKPKTATKKPVQTTQPTTQAPSTTATIPFATAIPPKNPVDYNAQWNLGYLVAIDNPDTIYACSKVNLTDEDRDLLERLCMGEFGTGGFIGAALIAQAVKDAMCFDGYTSVESVIKNCRYTGSTKIAANSACKQAVKYIFDENHDAVQHRIMYMYNPNLVQSAFHESQNYIMTYQNVRFFDRWGY